MKLLGSNFNDIKGTAVGRVILAAVVCLGVAVPHAALAQIYFDSDPVELAIEVADDAEAVAQWAIQNAYSLLQITYTQDQTQVTAGGFTATNNALQLNAEENSQVLQGTSQAIIDNDKIIAQASDAADFQGDAVVPVLATGCTIASAYQKRNASERAANSASTSYVTLVSREGTGAYGAVPNNNGLSSISKRLCGRMGGSGGSSWTFVEVHGGLEGQLKCN